MQLSPNLLLPYPGENDLPDGSAQIKGMIDRLEALRGGYAEIGSMMDYAGSADPPSGNWLITDGRVLLRSSYPELFNLIGTRYNTGGEATTEFRLPLVQRRMVYAAAPGDTIGAVGGEETHLLAWNESGVNGYGTTNQVNTDHYHGVSGSGSGTTAGDYPDHYHLTNLTAVMEGTGAGKVALGTGYGVTVNTSYPYVQGATARHQHNFSVAVSGNTNWQSQQVGGHLHTHTLNARNADAAHNNMPPYILFFKLIRVR